jgi:serine/threonine-protein kinase
MATVWLGRATRQGRFERLVAIKTVHATLSADGRSREMFVREAEIAATIHHANVIDVFDVGETDGVLYQVMTLVEGSDLRHITVRFGQPLPAGLLTSIVCDALRGLHAAHEAPAPNGQPQLRVHLDVSPQNILVGLDGIARISDFGIARVFTAGEDATKSLRGKFSYFSPEQATGGSLDRRTDLFAMGIILWECLTGERLFRGRDMFESLEKVKNQPIIHPSKVRSSAARALGDVAMRALERDREGRFATAAEMVSALAEAARAEGITYSTDDVARFVEGLVGNEVRERTRAPTRAGAGAAEVAVPDAGAFAAKTASYVTDDHSAPDRQDVAAPTDSLPTIVEVRSPEPVERRHSRARALVWAIAILAMVAAAALALAATLRKTDPVPAPAPVASASTPSAPSASAASSIATEPATTAPPSSTAHVAPPRDAPRRRMEKKTPPATTPRDPPYTENPFKR